MHSFIQELILNNEATWLIENMFVPERQTIINKGEMWILGDIVITKSDVLDIANSRIASLVKFLSGSTESERMFLKDTVKYWKLLIEHLKR